MSRISGSSKLSPPRYGAELLVSLATVLLVTAGWYAATARGGIPQPSSLLGHGLGIVGFLLMLSTETLYSIRKRWATSSRLPTRIWLQIHICTGIVGSYMVLLHSAGKFHGLAGWLTLLTLVTVASGFVGRYLYTALPRTLDGVAALPELEEEIALADEELRNSGVSAEVSRLLTQATTVSRGSWLLVLGRPWWRRQQRQRLRRALDEAASASIVSIGSLDKLLENRLNLEMEMAALAATRRLMAWWHFFHVPLGVVLFTLAFIHIGAALHYATLLK